MGRGAGVTIVNVGYRSVNVWVVSAGKSRLVVDLGWPGMVKSLLANLKRKDIPVSELKYGFATHYHIDHAGGAQDLKELGMRLIVTPEQVPFIPAMKRWTKPVDNFLDIVMDDNLVVTTQESRPLLTKMGISGELVHTPGHSDDSISLVLDHGIAFTGDLTLPSRVGPEDPHVVAQSWQLLRDKGVTTVYGGHGPPQPLETLLAK